MPIFAIGKKHNNNKSFYNYAYLRLLRRRMSRERHLRR